VVPDVKPRDVSTTPAEDGRSNVTSRGEDLLDYIDRMSQTTSCERRQSPRLVIDDDFFL